jgi:hypothetical protein
MIQEFEALVAELEIDEQLTEEDVMMWGYDNWDDFWESNV